MIDLLQHHRDTGALDGVIEEGDPGDGCQAVTAVIQAVTEEGEDPGDWCQAALVIVSVLGTLDNLVLSRLEIPCAIVPSYQKVLHVIE